MFHREMSGSRAETKKMQDKYVVVPENKEVPKSDGAMSKIYRSQFEWNFNGQIWDDLSENEWINNDYNGLKSIG